MTRYQGYVGVKTEPVETEPGIFTARIIEVSITGSLSHKPVRWQGGELSQDTPKANHILSFIAPDVPSNINFADVVYVTWQNRPWTVVAIEDARPRYILTLGGVYNGR